ncbi:3-oxoacyl-ACP reductase [Marinicauda salina]|uniref:3-oxoacyl-ACP reductase n=1 Tax=Marinicauda salina TaxID=2135793 RepID=A0A2U2BQX5_9PROT|nr:SDR family oxidoreductase [Marinicauda salina]PWE16378.1 3-oxoacyl-ACP reductase [Marinicauda salina]
MPGLADKNILVTGASRGTGAAIAKTLAGQGAKVVVHYGRNRDAAEDVANDLGGNFLGLMSADFATPGAAPEAWAEAKKLAGGRLDGLVINHGIFEAASIEADYETWRANWTRTLEVDLLSAADLAREAARDWRGRADDPGAMVAIASRAAHRGDDPDHPSYAAAKAGLIGLIKTLARAYSGDGVLAYAIAPGWIDTEMAPQEPGARAKALAEVPYGQMAQPEEFGRLCAFLLSGACPSATGATFDVNGASYVR